MAPPKLVVVGAGRVFIGSLEVVAAPEDQPPFDVDVIVEEEDRHLVLSAPAVVPERPDHPIRVMTALWDSEPRGLGDVVLQRGSPPRLLAIVHDLDREPTVEAATVRDALAKSLALADALAARAMKLPLLGAVHGTLAPALAAELIGEGLRSATPKALARVWLVTSDPDATIAAL
ncbi:hypothetical protein L6R52_04440 [Myxococcota bacterium]|nr:hypothetical protein [Myxococcota bacterium]